MFFLDRLSYRALQRLVILLVLLHNLEEALTLPLWLPAIRRRLSGLAPDLFLDAIRDPSRFYTSLAAATVVPALVVLLATLGRPSGIAAWSVVFVQSLFLVNVFVPHVPMAIALGGYAPGVGTALLVNFAVLGVLPQAQRESWRGQPERCRAGGGAGTAGTGPVTRRTLRIARSCDFRVRFCATALVFLHQDRINSFVNYRVERGPGSGTDNLSS